MTPLNIKKAIGSAFRSKGIKNKSSTYQLMKKQDQTIDRDQSKSKGVKVHKDFWSLLTVLLKITSVVSLGDHPNEGEGEAGKKSKNFAQVEEL